MKFLLIFMITLLGYFPYIKLMRYLKYGQSIREEGPQSHLQKTGTPTIGGLIFVLVSLIAFLVMEYNALEKISLSLMICYLLFAMIGFIDDILILIQKKNDGLKPKEKLLLLFIVSAIFLFLISDQLDTRIYFTKHLFIDFGYLYYPLIILYITAWANAFNITDGIDGLAGGLSIISLSFLLLIALMNKLNYLSLPISLVLVTVFSFLIVNFKPAKIFMGDCGSLALGAFIAMISIILKIEVYLFFFGFIYLIEIFSVIIQVAYYKKTRKRIFKMSPIHHHFELSNWNEYKIVSIFYLTQIIVSVIGLGIYLWMY